MVAGLRAVEAPPGTIKIKGVVVTDPQDADATYKPLDFYLAHGDPYSNEGLSLFNSLRAFTSLEVCVCVCVCGGGGGGGFKSLLD